MNNPYPLAVRRFFTGQHIIRSGLSKVGFPGAPMGMSQLDPSIGGLLKSLGYATGHSARTTLATRMNFCRPCTASTNSSGTSITSTLRKNRRTRTIRSIRNSRRSSARAAYAQATDKDDASRSALR